MKTSRLAVVALLGVLTPGCASHRTFGVEDEEWVGEGFPEEEKAFPSQGDRVRLRVIQRGPLEGTLLSVDRDSVSIQHGPVTGMVPSDTTRTATFAWAELESVEVSRGIKRGVAKGVVVSALVAAVSGYYACRPDPDRDGWNLDLETECRLLIGGLVLGLGTLVSLGWKTEVWEEVERSSFQPSLQLSPDGRFGLRFSMPLRR